ncbi:MAG: class I SAM-dependent methyltransferase [Humidesulfovibrio sp.]
MGSEEAWRCSVTPEAAYSAKRIAGMVLEIFPGTASVVDVGCGAGTVLRAFLDLGVPRVRGLDAAWVARDQLAIPEDCFTTVDLERGINAPGRFDLAVCLEVAEHLAPGRAASFVAELAGLSDLILFSAAIPGQGGVGHINEQWQSYWAGLFGQHGLRCYDVLRPRLWDDPGVPPWYKQNTLLFSSRELPLPQAAGMLDLVHPETYRGIHFRDVTPWVYLNVKTRSWLSRRFGGRRPG